MLTSKHEVAPVHVMKECEGMEV